jgi:hypothetical protein
MTGLPNNAVIESAALVVVSGETACARGSANKAVAIAAEKISFNFM